jgi:hypothetical protein
LFRFLLRAFQLEEARFYVFDFNGLDGVIQYAIRRLHVQTPARLNPQ